MEDNGISELKASMVTLHAAITRLREERDKPWPEMPTMPVQSQNDWNFSTFKVHIDQRFVDLNLQLQQRFDAQQTSVGTAMVAAEKAVNAALIAAEKAVDKAEQAQALRNEAQNEFRKSLSDLSGLMWTIKEGSASVDALRREIDIRHAAMEEKINVLNQNYSNIQGRMAMIGIVWGVIVAVASAAIQYYRS